MKTFPDFTWEWIIQSCERFCDELQHSQEITSLPERIQGYIATAKAVIAIVPKLREHPQLEKLVPMKSLLALRWFPTEDREIDLLYEPSKGEYSIAVFAVISIEIESVIEEKYVAFNDVADEIYAYITKLRDD